MKCSRLTIIVCSLENGNSRVEPDKEQLLSEMCSIDDIVSSLENGNSRVEPDKERPLSEICSIDDIASSPDDGNPRVEPDKEQSLSEKRFGDGFCRSKGYEKEGVKLSVEFELI